MKFPAKGSLGDSKLIELLKDAAQSALTGMIRLENGPIIKVIYFQKGTVSFASSNEKSDRLTEVLKRAGKLTPEQVQDAQARVKPNVSLGKTLVELGYISSRDLLGGARAQVDGILHQLLFWNTGKYQILEGTLPREIIHLNLPVASIILDGIMKTQNRDWILQHIGSPEAVYAISTDFDAQSQALKLPVSSVASKLNGRRSLHEIAQMSGMDTFELCKTVVALEYLDLAGPIQDEPLEITLNAPEEEQPLNTSVEAQPVSIGVQESERLGQVLQLPMVEELQKITPEQDERRSNVEEPADRSPAPAGPNDADQVNESAVQEKISQESSSAIVEPEEVIQPASPEPAPEMRVPMQNLLRESETESESRRSGSNWKRIAVIVIIAAILGVGAFYYLKTKNKPSERVDSIPTDAPVVKSVDVPAQEVTSPPESIDTPSEDETNLPDAVVDETPLTLLRDGKLSDAATLWNNELAKNKTGYSIQVVIACQEKTVLETYQLLNYSEEIIILPLNFKGQNCYRVLFGQFQSRQYAQAAIKTLPNIFMRQSSPASVVALSKVVS